MRARKLNFIFISKANLDYIHVLMTHIIAGKYIGNESYRRGSWASHIFYAILHVLYTIIKISFLVKISFERHIDKYKDSDFPECILYS